MASMISWMVRDGFSGGSTVKAEAFLKYASSVPSKQSKTVKCDLSGDLSHLRVPRPSICSHRMRLLTGRRKTMNSRAGMSTPVESMSTRDDDAGLGRLRNSRMRCKGRSTVGLPVIFCTNESPRPKTSRHRLTSWSACEMCGRSLAAKISVLGNRP